MVFIYKLSLIKPLSSLNKTITDFDILREKQSIKGNEIEEIYKDNKKKAETISMTLDSLHTAKKNIQKLLNLNIMSNGWLKMFEIMHIIRANYGGLFTKTTIKSFHICELPGAFIMACEYYLKAFHNIKLDWKAQSLNPNKFSEAFDDKYKIYENNKEKYYFGKNDTGDIIDLSNDYINFGKFDFITSDCGQKCENECMNEQDIFEMKLQYHQMIVALHCLNEKGCYIFKFRMIYTKIAIYMIYKLYGYFYDIIIFKPYTSRPKNSEYYILCLGRNKTNIDIIQYDDINGYDISNIPQQFIDIMFMLSEAMTNYKIYYMDKYINFYRSNIKGKEYISDKKQLNFFIKNYLSMKQPEYNYNEFIDNY